MRSKLLVALQPKVPRHYVNSFAGRQRLGPEGRRPTHIENIPNHEIAVGLSIPTRAAAFAGNYTVHESLFPDSFLICSKNSYRVGLSLPSTTSRSRRKLAQEDSPMKLFPANDGITAREDCGCVAVGTTFKACSNHEPAYTAKSLKEWKERKDRFLNATAAARQNTDWLTPDRQV